MATFRNSVMIVRPAEEIFGVTVSAPLVQLGPGLPMINEVQAFRSTRVRGAL